MKKVIGVAALSLFLLSHLPVSAQDSAKIRIVDVQMTTGINDNLTPAGRTYIFNKGTSKVYCWFRWENAKINTKLQTAWYYSADDISILNYAFTIPRTEGSGSVSLSMPNNKPFPPGLYNVQIKLEGEILSSLLFRVE